MAENPRIRHPAVKTSGDSLHTSPPVIQLSPVVVRMCPLFLAPSPQA
jgi:hypothetical protein